VRNGEAGRKHGGGKDKPHFDRVQTSNVNVVYTNTVSFCLYQNFNSLARGGYRAQGAS